MKTQRRNRSRKSASHRRRRPINWPRFKARIDAFVGGMFTDKTTRAEQIHHLYHDIAGIPTCIIKPHVDTRLGDPGIIRSHRDNGGRWSINGFVARTAEDVYRIGSRHRVVILDEVHMWPPSLANVLRRLVRQGIRVFCFGLDETYEGRLFATTATILALSETKVYKERGICVRCRGVGKKSQRIWHGRPVNIRNKRLSVLTLGSKNIYRLLCDDCFYRTTPGIKYLLQKGLVGTIDPRTAWGEWLIPGQLIKRKKGR